MVDALARLRGPIGATLTVVFAIAGCGVTGPTVIPSLLPTPSPTSSLAASNAATQPASADPTFPPSQTPIEPGTYRWTGFEHPISIKLGAGWELGHDNPSFFDLFRGSTFPSITFARFTDVYVDATTRTPAVDAASVVATFQARADMTLTGAAAIELAGLHGQQFDLVTLAAKTPLYFGLAGDFRLDPEFKTRYRVLDVPGVGILVIGVHDHVAAFDAAIALGDPVVATLTVAP